MRRTTDVDARIRERHAKGHSSERIALSLKVSPHFIRLRLEMMGLDDRDRSDVGHGERNRDLIPKGVTAPLFSEDWWDQCDELFKTAFFAANGGDYHAGTASGGGSGFRVRGPGE